MNQQESQSIQQVVHTLVLMDISLTSVCIKGNIYIADFNNNRIRKVTISTGIITTIAGTGTFGYSGDNGPATSAGLYAPQGVALDASGKCFFMFYYLITLTSSFIVGSNLYIADRGNQRIRKVVMSTGIISTVAGTGTASFSGDNGLATSATFNSPLQVTLDAAGTVYLALSFILSLLIFCQY